MIFDNLSFGAHFKRISDNQRYIKIKPYTVAFGWSVWYITNDGNRNDCNAISYEGVPVHLKFDVDVAPVTFQDTLIEVDSEQKTVDSIIPSDLLKTDGDLSCFDSSVKCSTFLCGNVADYQIKDTYIYKCKKCYDYNNWHPSGIPIYKKSIDKSESSDNIFKSSDTVSDEETLLKNKHIETTNKMQTYNTLKEAVLAAITELRNAGSLSAYQVTQYIREQTNNGKWEVTSCSARPNGQNIKFWINHDDVRREVNELYANHELDTLGFTNRNYNGTYLVYEFDTTNLPLVANGATPVPNSPSNSNTVIGSTAPNLDVVTSVAQYLEKHIDDVEAPTLKKIQSAVKVNGVTCEQFAKIVENLGYNVVSGTAGFYSTYYVTTK